jgi:hypothetical protein
VIAPSSEDSVGHITSRMGNSFVHDDTSSAVLIAEGEARPGPIVRFISSDVVLVGDVGLLAPRCKSSLSGLPDKGCAGDVVRSGAATRERKSRTRSLMVACCASVATVLSVRKNRYCRSMGASDSAFPDVPSPGVT